MKRRILSASSLCAVLTIAAMLLPVTARAQGYEQEINALSAKMAANIAKAGKSRVAVVDFTDLEGNVTALGRFIAEEFSVAMLNVGANFELMDRTHLQTLLKQHKLSATGLIDPATAQQLGKIAGVDALVTGTITPVGENIRLAVKILDANTAKLIGANSGNIPATEAIKVLLNQGISTGDTGTAQTGTAAPKTPKPEGKAQQTAEAKGFIFQLQGCKRTGESVTCSFVITSKDQDKDIEVYASYNGLARIFDEMGNEYKANHAQIADKSSDNYAKSLLVANLPTKATVTFGGISPEANMITLLEFWGYYGDSFKVQFRNVPFSK